MMPQHLAHRQPSSRSLETLYPWPNEFRSREDWYRRRNLDLAGFDDPDDAEPPEHPDDEAA